MLSERDINYVARNVNAISAEMLQVHLSEDVTQSLLGRSIYGTKQRLLEEMNRNNPLARIEVSPEEFSHVLYSEGLPVHQDFAELLYPLELAEHRQVVQPLWATESSIKLEGEILAMVLEYAGDKQIGERKGSVTVCGLRSGFEPSNNPIMIPRLHPVRYLA